MSISISSLVKISFTPLTLLWSRKINLSCLSPDWPSKSSTSKSWSYQRALNRRLQSTDRIKSSSSSPRSRQRSLTCTTSQCICRPISTLTTLSGSMKSLVSWTKWSQMMMVLCLRLMRSTIYIRQALITAVKMELVGNQICRRTLRKWELHFARQVFTNLAVR